MICNHADLDAAIDWLEAVGYDRAIGFTGDTEVHEYRGHYIWRRTDRMFAYTTAQPFYLLDGLPGVYVAPWVVEAGVKRKPVDAG